MVKISIQKGKKATKPKPKPRQKQKQKQSQKVVLNMGKGPQKPTHTPIYIPQSNPIMMKPQTQQSMIELIKYLRESEGQRTATKEKESNELEKEKKKDTPDDKQVYFSTTDNQNITPPSTKPVDYVLPTNLKPSAGPHNPLSFYDSMYASQKHKADLQGENPNTGQLSLSQPASQPTASSILRHHSTNTQLTDLLRSRLKPERPIPEPEPQPAPI